MTRKLRFAIAGIGLVVIVFLAWFLLLDPLRGDIRATSETIEAEQIKLATAQTKLAQAEVTRAEGRQNQARLLELAKMVPSSAEMPSLLLQIQDLADQSGIEFISVTPGQPSQAEGFQVLPLSLEFTGTFFDLSDFVFRAEQLVAAPGRLLALKQLDLRLGGTETDSPAGEDSSPTLGVRMVLYAFETASTGAGGGPIPVDTAEPAGEDDTTPAPGDGGS